MGLDTYTSRTPGDVTLNPEDIAAFEAAAVSLCGGMHSGDDVSFRGKIYDGLILEVTDHSLYEEWTSPEDVADIASKLGALTPEELAVVSAGIEVRSDRVINAVECAELQKFFRTAAECGVGLIGWW